MNSWGKGWQAFLFLLLALLACDDDSYLLGFKSPDENFKVVYTEFNLPTTVFMVDSLVTYNSSQSLTKRLMVGSYTDPRWGATTASSYLQFYPAQFPTFDTTAAKRATFSHMTITMVYDYYTFGSRAASAQTFDFYALDDSLVNSSTYYSKSATPLKAQRIGTITDVVNPLDFDNLLAENSKDTRADNDAIDSLNVLLDPAFGQEIFDIMKKNDSVSQATYRAFSKWRRYFKGIGIKASSSDKVVGFAIANTYSRMTLFYKEGTETKKVELHISPTAFQMSYSGYEIDRSGSLVAGITEPYLSFDPADGSRYIQSGGGIATRIDLGPVYDYFAAIKIKSLNAAEFSIKAIEQPLAPLTFALRAVESDNHTLLAITKGRNEAYDSIAVIDSKFMGQHFINSASAPRADVLGDNADILSLDKTTTSGVTTYKGYLTTFLQREVDLGSSEQLRYFSIVPSQPEFAKSFNGMIFHKDSVKLRIYYTTPIIEE